ncbi:MAG: N-6 DNA methylase, partial [Chitinophagales bacterium]|nr:N-6 DNA methylase [Chitinophagales bacterium]
MALFQKSVLNQYLKDLNKGDIINAYSNFKAHFQNPIIQQHIRESKEEQYQGEFLIDLFVNVLGYTKNPQPNFNLQTEQKNETNSKKADGAILKDGNVIAVIELKGTNTTDLNTVTAQAFGYKNNQKNCKYVLISNFEKLRFYIDNAIDFEEFNLFTLTENEFALLYLCLHYENLLSDLPNKIKQASTVKEENITKQLYKDYSELKRKLFADIVQLNPQYDKLILFKKSQKLLDRILFILFAEDRALLPANTIQNILDEFDTLKKLDAYSPLFDRFKKHFNYLNTGFKNEKYEIFGYNGGLFATDEILDTILISDNLLQNYIPTLSKYDYDTEIDVNILGHIFEHSLNDIEEIQAELSSMDHDPLKSNTITKRKKDGVFYTPKYITKYIVENTIGALCTEKRNEFEVIAGNYTPDKRKTKKKELLQKLDAYQSWLLQITIVDPACGSGAFLNQALDFLIQEHKSIDELRAQLLGHSFAIPDHEVAILENNIFGVDLNEESVEIARLSLWLRTARKGRKLNSLNNNIKCGNSLIDDATIAGEKAFNWHSEFPQIFKPKDKQAFHIVLTTHNSRTSQRMIDYGVIKGDAIELNLNEEIELTKIIGNIISESKMKCIAYNICKDHVHLIVVCEGTELTSIIQKIKSISSKEFHRLKIPMGHDPLEHKNHLWSQKFYRANLDVWELNTISNKPGYIYKSSYLQNAIEYIKNNRVKHNLPQSKELEKTINSFCVAEDNAFKPEHNGGFDVVIGNPPYTYRKAIEENEKNYFKNNFISNEGNFDLYKFFMELLVRLTSNNSYSSFIVPNTFLSALTYKKLREIINSNFSVIEFYDLGLEIFENVVVESIVFTLRKSKIKIPTQIKIQRDRLRDFSNLQDSYEINLQKYFDLDGTFNIYLSDKHAKIIDKISLKSTSLSDICYCTVGINTGYIKSELTSNFKIDARFHKMLNGKDISRNYVEWNNEWIMYDTDFVKSKGELGRALPPEYIFLENKILVQRTRRGMKRKLVCYFDTEKYYNLNRLSNIVLKSKEYDLKYIYILLNSQLLDYYFNIYFNEYEVKPAHLSKLPIKQISLSEQQPFIEKAETMLQKNAEMQTIKNNFIKLLQSRYSEI